MRIISLLQVQPDYVLTVRYNIILSAVWGSLTTHEPANSPALNVCDWFLAQTDALKEKLSMSQPNSQLLWTLFWLILTFCLRLRKRREFWSFFLQIWRVHILFLQFMVETDWGTSHIVKVGRPHIYHTSDNIIQNFLAFRFPHDIFQFPALANGV